MGASKFGQESADDCIRGQILELPLNNRVLREIGMASNPKNGIPGFSLHFPKELSYGYLWFEGNGKIPLGRQGKRSLKGRAYSKK